MVTKGSNDKEDWIQEGWSIDVLVLELILSLEPSFPGVSWLTVASFTAAVAAESGVCVRSTGTTGAFPASPFALLSLQLFEFEPADPIPTSASTGSGVETLGDPHSGRHIVGTVYRVAWNIYLWGTSSDG